MKSHRDDHSVRPTKPQAVSPRAFNAREWSWLSANQRYIRIRRLPSGMRVRMFLVWGPDAIDAFDWRTLGDGQYEFLAAARDHEVSVRVRVTDGEPTYGESLLLR